ncbi:MAG: hypothetical protein QM658_14575 [Gordonia sp. (in: high G+C Gram-positive bacteria)]
MTTRRTRSSLLVALPLVSAGLLLTGCGDFPRSNPSPSAAKDSARSVVDTYVSSFNADGVGEAVRRTFCAADVDRYSSGESGPEVVAGSLTLSEVHVKNKTADAQIAGATRVGTTDRFTLTMRDDKSQGWCITGVKNADS